MDFDTLLDAFVIVISVWSAFFTNAMRIQTQRLEQEFAVQREETSRRLQREDVMARYREPVLRSAVDLQSRLYNIDRNRFLHVFFNTTDAERSYALTSTLYVVAEYLGWAEILRREVQYLDMGDLQANQRLAELLESVTTTFLTDESAKSMRLFRGEQRAIGELMLVARSGSNQRQYECLGFAAFTEKLEDPAFAKWFAKLEEDVKYLAKSDSARDRRLVQLQHALIDLIDFLDPNRARVSDHRRKKLPLELMPAEEPAQIRLTEALDPISAGAEPART